MQQHPELVNNHPSNESVDARIRRKARQLRRSLILSGLVVSPDADMNFEDLPEARKVKWLKLAAEYVLWF